MPVALPSVQMPTTALAPPAFNLQNLQALHQMQQALPFAMGYNPGYNLYHSLQALQHYGNISAQQQLRQSLINMLGR